MSIEQITPATPPRRHSGQLLSSSRHHTIRQQRTLQAACADVTREAAHTSERAQRILNRLFLVALAAAIGGAYIGVSVNDDHVAQAEHQQHVARVAP